MSRFNVIGRPIVFVILLASFGAAAWYWWPLETPPSRDQTAATAASAKKTPATDDKPSAAPDSQDEAAWLALRDKLAGTLEQSARPGPQAQGDTLRDRLAALPDSPTEAALLEAAGITPEDEAAYEQWARERGFDRESTGYQYYDRETLQALAASGDMYAQQRLGFQAANEHDFLRAEVLLKQAATQGSAYALDLLAFNATSRAIEANQQENQAQAKRQLLEAFAWSELANRRGYGDMPIAGFREGNIQRNLGDMGLELTPEDRQRIEKMAQRRYEAMERERAERGQAPFDNATPAFFEKLKRAREAFQEIRSEKAE
ncbi:hypothetical protein [Marinimicrobium locisalis]|uniref:hypothetical protein n=1 Tax=Marinimicrobium locisalis TaxID=546022 RepID=UPI0032219F71